MAHTYLPIGLAKIEHYSSIRLIQDLTYVFNDGPVLRMGRVRDPFNVEFRSWLERTRTAASCGILINPTLKRQLLHELYDFEHEPFHAVGQTVIMSDAPNSYSWPEDTQVLRKRDIWARKTVIVVAFQKNYKLVLNIPIFCPFPEIQPLQAVAAPTSGPNAIIPQPAPLSLALPTEYEEATPVASEPLTPNPSIYPQRQIAGVKRNRHRQLVKGWNKKS